MSVVYLGANLADFLERLAEAKILSHLSWTPAGNTLQEVCLGDFISSGCKPGSKILVCESLVSLFVHFLEKSEKKT